MKFDKDPWALEQNDYLTKIVNVYIVYDLDACPRNLTNHFKFKNFLFRATSIVKNSDKEKYVYSGYRITFDNPGSRSLDIDFAVNVINFGVDNSLSSHSDNCKINFLILGEGPSYGINGSFGSPGKKFSINFSKTNTKFCLSLQVIVICLLIEKKSLNLKLTTNMLTFELNFVSKVYLMDLIPLSRMKYLYMEMCMIFQSITIVLINLRY